jgi:hypothetical protein
MISISLPRLPEGDMHYLRRPANLYLQPMVRQQAIDAYRNINADYCPKNAFCARALLCLLPFCLTIRIISQFACTIVPVSA